MNISREPRTTIHGSKGKHETVFEMYLKSIRTGSTLVVARAGEKGYRDGVLLWNDGNVLKLDRGGSYTTLRMY